MSTKQLDKLDNEEVPFNEYMRIQIDSCKYAVLVQTILINYHNPLDFKVHSTNFMDKIHTFLYIYKHRMADANSNA